MKTLEIANTTIAFNNIRHSTTNRQKRCCSKEQFEEICYLIRTWTMMMEDDYNNTYHY